MPPAQDWPGFARGTQVPQPVVPSILQPSLWHWSGMPHAPPLATVPAGGRHAAGGSYDPASSSAQESVAYALPHPSA